VSSAIELENEGRLEDALDTFEEVLASSGNSRRDLATIFEHLAVLRFAAGDEQGALEAFSRMLAVSPTASMPDSAPPDMQPLFDRAASRWRGHTLRADIEEQGVEDGEVSLEVRVIDDLLDMVGGVQVARGATTLATSRGYGPSWDLQVPLDELDSDDPVVTVRLVDVYGGVVWEGTHEIVTSGEPAEEPTVEHRTEPVDGLRGQRIAAYVFIGTGLAVAAAGIALVAIDGEWTGETRVNNGMIEWEIRDTAVGGGVMIGLGGAAAVGGLIWVLMTRRSRRNTARVMRLARGVVASW